MIFNEPSSTSLEAAALRFHFSAWDLLIEIAANFDDYNNYSDDESEATWFVEWEDYLAKASYDLQTIFTYVAQSSELALKARICAVSPYLLLLNTENKFKQSSGKVDFTELRTIDAVDLPMVVNAVCDKPLSQGFLNLYNEIRSLRNKILHLGFGEDKYQFHSATAKLVEQYWELWGQSNFFKKWIDYSTRKRSSHFFDYKNYTEYTDVMLSVPFLESHLTKGQFKRLFGFEKSKRRYICYDCCSAACLERQGVSLSEFRTAILKDDKHIHCAVCDQDHPIIRSKCSDSDCKGNVVLNSEEYSPVCLSCGYPQHQ